MNEKAIMIREIINKDVNEKKIISVVRPVDICSCGWKSLSVSPIPEWLNDAVCSKCNVIVKSDGLFRDGCGMFIQKDNNAPELYCNSCCLQTLDCNCTYSIVEEEKVILEDEDYVKWLGRVYWSPNEGENWYSVAHDKVLTYTNYVSDKTYLNKCLNKLRKKLNEGKTLTIRGYYEKNPIKTLHVNASSI